MHISQLPTPALLLDIDILQRNLRRMQDRAEKLKVALRPHIKTHKCIEIGKKQLTLGAKGITVSTFYEAERFAAAGFDDITWAFPLPPVYAIKVAELAERITFNVVIDSKEAKGHLDKVARVNGKRIHVWLKIDSGNHRAGVDPNSKLAEEITESLAESNALAFDGILTHAGHSYHAKTREGILKVAIQERDVMLEFAGRMRAKRIPVPSISIGSTPSMTVIDNLSGIDEIRPGNYCFHDYTMVALGVCGAEDCAVTVLASVISHQPGASHFVTDAGALALSKDLGPTHLKNDMDMGTVYENYEKKRLHAHIHVRGLSQEHGKVVAHGIDEIEGKFRVGDRVRILENHSCLTVPHFQKYYVVKQDEVVDEWSILGGRI